MCACKGISSRRRGESGSLLLRICISKGFLWRGEGFLSWDSPRRKEAPLIDMHISDGFRKNVSEKGYSSLEKNEHLHVREDLSDVYSSKLQKKIVNAVT